MNRDDIIRMAREAQAVYATETWAIFLSANQLEHFANLVAAAEREACAKVCELVAREIDDTNGTATYCAAAIRARGEK